MAGTTPIYGFPYPESTDLVANYPALGQELAEDVETVISGLGSGLNLITPTSIAFSGGSASSTSGVTTFTGVNSVSLNGVFSATYANYLVIVSRATFSGTGSDFRLRLRVGGADDSTSNYARQQIYAASTSLSAASTTADQEFTMNGSGATDFYTRMEIYSPFLVQKTAMISNGYTDIPAALLRNHMFRATTSFDGFSIYPTTGSMSGAVFVYGYKGA